MDFFGWVLAIAGLIASITGTCLAYFTYVSPIIRIKAYLRRPEGWEKVFTDVRGTNFHWRYSRHPEFVIQEDNYDNSRYWDRTEHWMPPCPDQGKTSNMVHVKVNGQIVLVEEFISLDGGRYFVPLPRRAVHDKENGNEYWYSELQVNISRIVGEYYHDGTIEKFIDKQKIPVKG